MIDLKHHKERKNKKHKRKRANTYNDPLKNYTTNSYVVSIDQKIYH